MNKDDSHYMVHVTHCCPDHCKYGDDDCPVALKEVEPMYKCEDCNCLLFNPELRFDVWWNGMTYAEKEQVSRNQQLMSDTWTDLRFVQRVLESPSPTDQDRTTARDMVLALRQLLWDAGRPTPIKFPETEQ